MNNTVLPPGTILALMYLKERLSLITPGYFIELGPGSDEVTSVLLESGWKGKSFDLHEPTVDALKMRFSSQINRGDYSVVKANWLDYESEFKSADLVISCMVMEHLDEDAESIFIRKAVDNMSNNGVIIGLVHASPDHWGIEDDIAEHFRRYTRESLGRLMQKNGRNITHIAGLTYPLSNLLLPISNYLVRRAEKSKLKLSMQEKTKQSGRRNVKFKTEFPLFLRVVLNPIFLHPLYLLQKMFKNSEKALIRYFESKYNQND